MELYRAAWEKSYVRKDNFIFYPKEEVLKFISRYVRKRVGLKEFNDVLDFKVKVRGLDLGCGIGRQAILMEEFGIESYGLDISAEAIARAKEMAIFFGLPLLADRLQVTDGASIPFPDNFFMVSICEAVLDSMTFELACKNINELSRVTEKLAFISLIFDQKGIKEEIVSTEHEKGTIQCYYDDKKIDSLLAGTGFIKKSQYLIKEIFSLPVYEHGRYFLILEKNG